MQTFSKGNPRGRLNVKVLNYLYKLHALPYKVPTYPPHCSFLPPYLFKTYTQPTNIYVIFIFKCYNYMSYLITCSIWLHLSPFLLAIFMFCPIWLHVLFDSMFHLIKPLFCKITFVIFDCMSHWLVFKNVILIN
jgi:hypothetical protein